MNLKAPLITCRSLVSTLFFVRPISCNVVAIEARNASDKSVLDLAVGEANTEIADYLRNMLPDGGEQHDRCRSKAGFKRAGRWMELARADGFLEDAVSFYRGIYFPRQPDRNARTVKRLIVLGMRWWLTQTIYPVVSVFNLESCHT